MKNSTLLAVILTAFLFFGIKQIILGQALLTDDFEYPANDNLTSHGWTAHSGAGTQPITVNNGGLSYTSYIGSGIGNAALLDNNGEDVSRTFTPQSSGTVYLSFMVKVDAFSEGYFLNLGPSTIGTTYRGKVFIGTGNHFGVSFASNTGTYASSTFAIGTTYLLVLKYEIVAGVTNDKVSLFILDGTIPSSEPALPSIGPITESTSSDIIPATVALRQYSTSQNILIDGIRVATNWTDACGYQIIAPTIQASNLLFSNNTGTGITPSWTNGNGEKRIVIISPTSGITAPADGTDPPAVAAYSGSGQQVVYNGAGTSQAITGLTPNTTYWFQVFEYNGSGTKTKYCTAIGANNPKSETTIFVATAPVVSSPTVSSITNSSAILGGTVVSDGGSAITERGTVWSINTPPTIDDNKIAEGSTSTGLFTQLRSGIPPGSEIFFAAYATNTIGTTLSAESVFTTLSDEPDSQASNFTSNSILYSSIAVSWSDNEGSQPASGFLILANTTGTFTAPLDGIVQSDDLVLNDGSGKVNVLHGTQTYTWTGLNPSTTYYFSIYPYTNSGTNIDYKTSASAPVTSATTTALPVITYTWTGPDNATWTTASNWNPVRSNPSNTDILQFTDGSTKTITSVPTQSIGRLLITGNTKITLQNTIAATLSLSGGSGTDLDIQNGCELNLAGSNAIIISLGALTTGSISGNMTFSSGAHQLLSATAGGITFNSNSVFKAATGFSGSSFGSSSPYNAVVFDSLSTYISQAGSNPFGASAPNSVVSFHPSSLYKVITGGSAAFSGRTYGNFELDAPGSSISPTGTSKVSIQNLTVTHGTMNFNMTGTPGHSIKGNISVASGAILNFSPASAGTVLLNGTSTQLISGGGPVTWGTSSTLSIANPANVTINTPAIINGTLSLSNGLLILSSNNLLLGPSAIISGTPSSSAMIVATGTGQLRKEMPISGGSFTFPVGDNTGSLEYSPLTLTFTGGTFGTGNYIGVTLANAAYPGNPVTDSYISRYWNISSSGITGFSCNATFNYISPGDVTGEEGSISCVLMSGTPVVYDLANPTLHQLTASNLTVFGTFTGVRMSKSLNLTLFLEGLYIGGGQMNKARDASGDKFPGNTADQIVVELHDATPGNYSNITHSSGLVNLSTSGQVTLDIPIATAGSYYITIRNRNCIATVSANPISFSGNSISYTFADASSKAYGSNLLLSTDGYYMIYGGDVNQDGVIDTTDLLLQQNDANNFVSGYVNTDVNGDGLIDLSDMIITDNNTAHLVISITP